MRQENNQGYAPVNAYEVDEVDGRFVARFWMNGQLIEVPAEIGSGTFYDQIRNVLVMKPALDD
jgi:hypothetical protein